MTISYERPFSEENHQTKLSSNHDKCIDELLEKYRPTQNAILECIACLDDASFVSTHPGRESLSRRESALMHTEKNRYPKYLTSTLSQRELESIPRLFQSESEPERRFNDSLSGLDRMESPIRKRRRWVMSMEEKEGRRRDQNREAQRRYRERHRHTLLLAPRQLYTRAIRDQDGAYISSNR